MEPAPSLGWVNANRNSWLQLLNEQTNGQGIVESTSANGPQPNTRPKNACYPSLSLMTLTLLMTHNLWFKSVKHTDPSHRLPGFRPSGFASWDFWAGPWLQTHPATPVGPWSMFHPKAGICFSSTTMFCISGGGPNFLLGLWGEGAGTVAILPPAQLWLCRSTW